MVAETSTDEITGETSMNLLPKDKWVESCLEKHIACGKKWGFNFFLSWIVPIVLIIVSFFLNFSVFALISLIGFIGALAGSLVYVRYKICSKCVIEKECHEAF
jgi:hypothetical protein